jgi:hypothetical protein
MKKKLFFSIILASSIFFQAGRLNAEEKDRALILETKYFSVYGSEQVSSASFVSKIRFRAICQPERIFGAEKEGVCDILGNPIDDIFTEVSDILDIHIPSYHAEIVVFPDSLALASFILSTYHKDFSGKSVFVSDINTIYVSLNDLSIDILAHEIARSIVSLYFVVPVSSKVQEILSSYVESHLSRTEKSVCGL